MHRPRSSVTIEQVAAAAGVSRSTVSRVVNGSTAVSPEAAESVRVAIERLNYVPNRAARSLAMGANHAVALVIPEDIERFFGDPYFAPIVKGIHARLSDSDYLLNLFVANDQLATKAANYLLGGNAGGALVISHHRADQYLQRLAANVPVVFGGRPGMSVPGLYVIDIDNVAASATATSYLIERGRSRLVTITGPDDMQVTTDRLAGFRETVRAAGLEPLAEEDGDFSFEGGAAAMARVLAAGVEFDGVVVQSDLMARGALSVLEARGIQVPTAVSVIGFDDVPLARDRKPHLTTIRQSLYGQGYLMADTLLTVLAGGEAPGLQLMETELVVRESA